MDKYIIEARTPSGALDLSGPQPESVFGMGAIHGMSTNAMADVIFRRIADATLDGGAIVTWPGLIDKRWIARRKTW